MRKPVLESTHLFGTLRRVDFRLKCAIQHALSVVPGGRSINYMLQRHVTRSLPASDETLERRRAAAMRHVTNYRTVNGRDPVDVFEFGSGWDLCVPMVLANTGCRVTASDVTRHVRPELQQDMQRRLGGKPMERITYLAPCDARRTGLADESFDMIVTVSVLEHIPAEDLAPIMRECRRLLRKDGICSFLVDYGDHWSIADRSISIHNYLRYDDRQWRIRNPSLQYQNRLRHSDYIALFEHGGFQIATVDPEKTIPVDVEVAEKFRRYEPADLSITSAWFVLRK